VPVSWKPLRKPTQRFVSIRAEVSRDSPALRILGQHDGMLRSKADRERTMKPLIFFENRAQVDWAKRDADQPSTLLALTAEAAQAFEENKMPYTAACDI